MKLMFFIPWPAVERVINYTYDADYQTLDNLPGITGENFRLLIDGEICSSDVGVIVLE